MKSRRVPLTVTLLAYNSLHKFGVPNQRLSLGPIGIYVNFFCASPFFCLGSWQIGHSFKPAYIFPSESRYKIQSFRQASNFSRGIRNGDTKLLASLKDFGKRLGCGREDFSQARESVTADLDMPWFILKMYICLVTASNTVVCDPENRGWLYRGSFETSSLNGNLGTAGMVKNFKCSFLWRWNVATDTHFPWHCAQRQNFCCTEIIKTHALVNKYIK